MFIAAVQNSLVNFSAVKIDTTDIFIFAGIILAAIGAIWGIRKMIALGYLSYVPGHWQKRYDREQDLADYKEFRDEGGFELGNHLGSFGGKTWFFGGLPDKSVLGDDDEYDQWAANYEPSSHVDDEDNWYQSPGDDLEGEYIGSVGDKSWYYDKEGNVYSDYDVEEFVNNDDPPTGWYDENDVFHSYEGHEDEYNEWLERIKNDEHEDEYVSVSVYPSYDAREEHREELLDFIDNRQDGFDSEWERVERHNEYDEMFDSYPYYGKDGEIYSGHEEQGGYDDIRKRWEK